MIEQRGIGLQLRGVLERAIRGAFGIPRRLPPGGEPVPPAPHRRVQPQGLAPEGDVAVLLPGCNFPPRGAIGVDQIDETDLTVPATDVVVATIPIPASWIFRVTHIGFSADDELSLAWVTWTLKKGGTPIGNFAARAAAIGSTHDPSGVGLLLIDGESTLTLEMRIAAVGSVYSHINSRIAGYYFQQPAEKD